MQLHPNHCRCLGHCKKNKESYTHKYCQKCKSVKLFEKCKSFRHLFGVLKQVCTYSCVECNYRTVLSINSTAERMTCVCPLCKNGEKTKKINCIKCKSKVKKYKCCIVDVMQSKFTHICGYSDELGHFTEVARKSVRTSPRGLV